MLTKLRWSDPHHGVQHLGEFSTQKPWATVSDYRTFAVLYTWHVGCRFSPGEATFDTAAEARSAGEEWFRAQGGA